jgi:hypothetical protein
VATSKILKKRSQLSPNSLGKQSYEIFANKRVNPISYVQLNNWYLPKNSDPPLPNPIEYIVTEEFNEILITEVETNPGQEQQLIVEIPTNIYTELDETLITENNNFIID